MTEKDIDEATGVSTTGHEWDGIKELNNPLPRWWVWTFYMTIVWAIAYTVAYPAWPLVSTATSGLLGYSSRTDVKNELAAAEAAKSRGRAPAHFRGRCRRGQVQG
jgi:cytochrome c oxidase cbb3-type subunit 3